jgi:subtilisin-like proprotein convertase family protein
MNRKMKLKFALAWLLLALGSVGYSQTISTNVAVNLAIPDNNPNGLVSAVNLSGLGGVINGVTVGLDITGGFNGDLYAYLAGPGGGFAVLLNRAGVDTGNGGSNNYGYSDTGFNITLDDSGTDNNVHYYQNDAPAYNGGGQLTGTWASDGENVDPLSSSVGLSLSLGQANLNAFNQTDPNGTWALYVADLSGGGSATLGNWTLNITMVPEPGTWALFGGGILMLLGINRWKRRGRVGNGGHGS